MSTDLHHLETLIERLRRLELHVPPAHERPIVEVARQALGEKIRALGERLHARSYLRGTPHEATAAAG